MGDRRFAVVAVLLLLSSSAPALEGTAIISTQTQTFLYNAATGRKTVLFNTGTNGACFSPDGRRVAAIPASQRLGIYDNDGTHGQVTSCSMVGTRHLNWCSNGYIYWPSNEGSPQRGHVYRMNAITKQVELMYESAIMCISDFEMSLDGSVGVWMGGCESVRDSSIFVKEGLIVPSMLRQELWFGADWGYGNWIFAWDFLRKRLQLVYMACNCAVSPSGTRVIMDCQGNHTSARMRAYPEGYGVRDCSGLTAPAGRSFEFWRYGPVSDDYAMFHSTSLSNQSNTDAWVIDLKTNTMTRITDCKDIEDFWMGPLPSPPSGAMELRLDKENLSFTASADSLAPASQTVTVTNAGTGTLEKVSVTTGPTAAWLTVTVGGSGNQQVLTNAVSAAGLRNGAYYATVTVTGGGASNPVSYTVILNLGTSVNAPSNPSAAPVSATSALLRWHDNASDETGFVVQRRSAASSWVLAGATAANDTDYADTGLATDRMYYYRVRAVRGTDSSGYTDSVAVQLLSRDTIVVTSPEAGTRFRPGDTCWIQWTSSPRVTNVYLRYSLDNGISWALARSDSSLTTASPLWQRYPWPVPAVNSATCLVKVSEYSDRCEGVSGAFTITDRASVRNRSPASGAHAGSRRALRVFTNGSHGVLFRQGSTAYLPNGCMVPRGKGARGSANGGYILVERK